MSNINYNILLKKFQDEVLNDLIKTDHLNTFYHGSPETRKETFLTLCSCNKHYIESDYYYKKNLKFVHFTSQINIEAIISSKVIRLANLSNQNDPLEFKFAANTLEIHEKHSEKTQKLIYSLSMCESEMVENLTLWRLYGENTKGVGIIFEITNDPIKWKNYHLSSIHYGLCDKIETFKHQRKEFEKKYNFRFPLSLDRFLAFHKSDNFKDELEIRLIHYIDNTKPFSAFPKVIDYVNLPKYISLDLQNLNEKQLDIKRCDEIPQIRIAEIVLGTNFSNNTVLSLIKNRLPEVMIRKSNLKFRAK